MATGNTNDLKRENASKPSAGYDTKRHAGKDPANIARPSHGGTPHPEKDARDVKDGKGGASKPSHGGTLNKAKKNGRNRVEPLSNPQGV